MQLNPACLKNIWHPLIPCDDVIVIDNLKNFETRFFVSTLSYSDGHPSRVSNPEQKFQNFFIFVHTYNHTSWRVHNCTKKTYLHFTYSASKTERLSQTASILPLTLFSQSQFMLVEPRIISERSRNFLLIFSASLEKLLENKLVVPR